VLPWRKDELVIVAPPDHALARKRRVILSDQLALGRIAVLPLRGLSFPRALSELRFAGHTPSSAAAAFRLALHTRTEAR
jgi:DNA-binding transcriptional LysR family regulator